MSVDAMQSGSTAGDGEPLSLLDNKETSTDKVANSILPTGAPPQPEDQVAFGRGAKTATAEKLLRVSLDGDAVDISAGNTATARRANAQYNFGTMIVNESDGACVSISFQDDLRQITELPTPLLPIAPELTGKYADILTEHRIVVIVHSSKQYREALSAMRSMLHCVRQREQGSRFFTSVCGGAFPLRDFNLVREWSETFRDSVIYLDRSAEATAFPFCDSESREALRKQLISMNSHLVLMASLETGSGSERFPYVGNWFIGTPEGPASADCAATFKGNFETIVMLCASLFPGLGVAEFVSLVERLAQPASRPEQPAATASNDGAVEPVEPTREHRWAAGERDRVLTELGVTFSFLDESAASGVAASAAGLMLADEQQRLAMPGWMLKRYPILLMQKLETLSAHYFSGAASARFRICYLNVLFQLDALRVFQLTPGWLLQWFRTLERSDEPFAGSLRFSHLLMKAMDCRNGEALVKSTLKGLVDGLLEQERTLLDSIPETSFAAALSAALSTSKEDAGDPSEAFWSTLSNLKEVAATTQAASSKILLALHVLIATSRHLPAVIVGEIDRALADDAVTGTRWTQFVGNAEKPWQIARLSRLALQWLLTQIIKEEPAQWVAFAQAVVEERLNEYSVRARSSGGDRTSAQSEVGNESAVARSLAVDCLVALADAISETGASPMRDAMYETLAAPEHRDRTGRLLAKLIVQSKVWEAPALVWLFRSCATALLARKGAIHADISDAVCSLVAPVRAAVTSRQRFAVSASARDLQQIYIARRNYFSAAGNRAQAHIERDHVSTMNIVIRAVSGPVPQTPA